MEPVNEVSIVETCETCGSDDLFEFDDEPGFEGEVVTVYSVCGAVYDLSGVMLDDGQA